MSRGLGKARGGSLLAPGCQVSLFFFFLYLLGKPARLTCPWGLVRARGVSVSLTIGGVTRWCCVPGCNKIKLEDVRRMKFRGLRRRAPCRRLSGWIAQHRDRSGSPSQLLWLSLRSRLLHAYVYRSFVCSRRAWGKGYHRGVKNGCQSVRQKAKSCGRGRKRGTLSISCLPPRFFLFEYTAYPFVSFSFKILPTCVIFSFKILPTSAIFSLWNTAYRLCHSLSKYCLPAWFFFQITAYLSDCFSSKILPTCVIFPAARLLLSRIGGIYNTRVRIKIATARPEKSRR